MRADVEAIYINEFWPVYNSKIEDLPPGIARKEEPEEGLMMVVTPTTFEHELVWYSAAKE